jgi:hypothetical protein
MVSSAVIRYKSRFGEPWSGPSVGAAMKSPNSCFMA